MKIIHFVLGRVSQETSNGVNKVVAGLAKYGNRNGDEISVIGLSKTQVDKYALIKRDGFIVESYNNFFKGAFLRIKELTDECDIVHLHSVWNHYNLVVAAYLRKINQPYVITAHAGFSEDRLRQSRYLLKMSYHYLFQKALFDYAAGVHALTREESTVLYSHINNSKIFVVNNGQDLDGVALKGRKYGDVAGPLKIGYLGRLSVEKNIDGLIVAISLLPKELKEQLTLHLIGPSGVDKSRLDALINKLGLEANIIFKGALYCEAKKSALLDLDFYIHPAFSDVVSIAVMEAMLLGLPSVITRSSDVSYFYDSGAFIMVEPDSKDIARGIIEMVEKRSNWEGMSEKATKLVENVFNWDVVVKKLSLEYKRCLDDRRV